MPIISTKNNDRDVSDLARELDILRSFVIGLSGKDREGNYRPKFVEKILKAAQEKEKFIFKDKNSFLSHLRKK